LAAKLKRNYPRYRADSRCCFGRAWRFRQSSRFQESLIPRVSLKRAAIPATRAQVSSKRPEERRKSAASAKRASEQKCSDGSFFPQFPFLPLCRGCAMVFRGRAKINSHKLETRSLRRDEVLVRASTSFSTAFLKSAGEMRERRERRPGSAAAAAAMATAATDRCCLRGLSSGTIRREEYIFLLWRNCNCDPSRGQSPSGVMIMSLSQRLISQNRCRRDRSIDCPLHDTKRPILKFSFSNAICAVKFSREHS